MVLLNLGSSTSLRHQKIFSGLHPSHQSYHYHHHSHHSYHISHLLHLEYYVPAQLRWQVHPKIQKHEVSHIKVTKAFKFIYQMPKLNYKQEMHTIQHLARAFFINPGLLHQDFRQFITIQGFKVSFNGMTYPTTSYCKPQK